MEHVEGQTCREQGCGPQEAVWRCAQFREVPLACARIKPGGSKPREGESATLVASPPAVIRASRPDFIERLSRLLRAGQGTTSSCWDPCRQCSASPQGPFFQTLSPGLSPAYRTSLTVVH